MNSDGLRKFFRVDKQLITRTSFLLRVVFNG